ncbi:MAG TPA: DUF1573 domain-containing protein [Phnomibacter sp.]|nr:DUF1573 domain-containing protein [Phnomibacter sp.]
MKLGKIVAIVAMVAMSTTLGAQAKIDELIRFEKTAYSFGKIAKEKPVTVEFVFSNPGTKPLIIADATAECGCTKPEFPKKPVMPGQKGTIKVTYDAKEPGVFTKKVTVTLVNVSETKILTIQGEVIK